MKPANMTKYLLPLSAGLGAVGFCLRLAQGAVAVDSRGLLTRGHPLTVLLWLLVPVAALGAIWLARGGEPGETEDSPVTTAGYLAGALGCIACLLNREEGAAWVAWRCLAAAAGLCLVYRARCSRLGRPCGTVGALGMCVFCLAHLVVNYRGWSADPQVMDYLFDLLAAIFLMLFSYYDAAATAGLGRPRLRLAAGGMAVTMCLTALADSQWPWLYLGGCLLAASGIAHRGEARHEAS